MKVNRRLKAIVNLKRLLAMFLLLQSLLCKQAWSLKEPKLQRVRGNLQRWMLIWWPLQCLQRLTVFLILHRQSGSSQKLKWWTALRLFEISRINLWTATHVRPFLWNNQLSNLTHRPYLPTTGMTPIMQIQMKKKTFQSQKLCAASLCLTLNMVVAAEEETSICQNRNSLQMMMIVWGMMTIRSLLTSVLALSLDVPTLHHSSFWNKLWARTHLKSPKTSKWTKCQLSTRSCSQALRERQLFSHPKNLGATSACKTR